jgi:hypothetical protein
MRPKGTAVFRYLPQGKTPAETGVEEMVYARREPATRASDWKSHLAAVELHHQ